jgi:hypothetical protein
MSSCKATAGLPLTVKCNENRAFRYQIAAAGRYNRSLFQWRTQKIRYLADQWNFNGILPPINEFKPPYQPKNNGVRAGRENGELGSWQRSPNAEPTAETDPGRTHLDPDFFARAFARMTKKDGVACPPARGRIGHVCRNTNQAA